jgi:hypothetical protein
VVAGAMAGKTIRASASSLAVAPVQPRSGRI